MNHHYLRRDILFYMSLSLLAVASQTWWYPGIIGWGKTLVLWIASAVAGGLIYALLCLSLFYGRTWRINFSNRVCVIVVLLTAAVLVGLSRALWIISQP